MKSSEEQLKAILIKGGATLKAGAGAGKTYVIIEHFVNELEKEMDTLLNSPSLEEKIKEVLRGYIIITFTKKAAQELKQRIDSRLEGLSHTNRFWKEIYNSMNYFFVGTIHSFCFTLLKDTKIISGESYQLCDEHIIGLKINSLIYEYLKNNPIPSDLLINLKDLEFIMAKIFSDPLLRVKWNEQLAYKVDRTQLENEFIDLFEPDLSQLSLGSKKKWEDFYSKSYLISLLEKKFESYEELFSEIKRSPPISKDASPLERNSYEELKDFRKKFLEFSKLLRLCEKNSVKIQQRFSAIKEIYTYISKRYSDDKKISFSDLEYLVLSTENHIDVNLRRLIVDEFQDVSWSQFEIFKKVLNEDFSKIYAIGDLKQAIYSFRGGEVSVFNDAMKKTENNLSLIDNYRSDSNIVSFNNNLFANYMDNFEKQVSQSKSKGKVILHKVSIEENYDFSKYPELESEYLFSSITDFCNKKNESNIAVIYKYISTARPLVEKIILGDFNYEAIYKVEYSEEPIASIISCLLEYKLKKINLSSCLFFIEGYLQYMGVSSENLESHINDFSKSINIMGLYQSFCRFLGLCKISHAYTDFSLVRFKELCFFYGDDFFFVLDGLKKISSERISLNLSHYSQKTSLQIMTAHASKGLEFDIVYVAGIMKNDRGRNDRVIIGQNPGSFSYIEETGDSVLTPQYFLEKELKKIEDDKESLRLFYVACTRAEKELHFILFENYIEKVGKKSWANFLLESDMGEDLEVLNQCVKLDLNIEKRRPSFHTVDLSIRETTRSYKISPVPEMSVTKLSKVALCPKKFYFSEVLKLDFEFLPGDLKINHEGKEKAISSAERGTKVHEEIENFLRSGLGDGPIIDFVKKILDFDESNSVKFIEEEIKFDIDGFMISGTPDLIISSDNIIEAVDFKTGNYSDENDQVYRSQLALYLYGFVNINSLKPKRVRARNIYIDLEKVVTFDWDDFSELDFEVRQLFDKCFNYQLMNKEHCSSCDFINICKPE